MKGITGDKIQRRKKNIRRRTKDKGHKKQKDIKEREEMVCTKSLGRIIEDVGNSHEGLDEFVVVTNVGISDTTRPLKNKLNNNQEKIVNLEHHRKWVEQVLLQTQFLIGWQEIAPDNDEQGTGALK